MCHIVFSPSPLRGAPLDYKQGEQLICLFCTSNVRFSDVKK